MPVVEHRPHLKHQQRQTLVIAPVSLLMRDDVRPWLRRFIESQRTSLARAVGSKIEILPDADREIDAELAKLAASGQSGNHDGKRSMKSRGFRLARSRAEFSAIERVQRETRFAIEFRLIGHGVPDHLRVPLTVRYATIATPAAHGTGSIDHSLTLPAREFARVLYGCYDQFVFLTTEAGKKSVIRREGRGPKSWIVVFPDDDTGAPEKPAA